MPRSPLKAKLPTLSARQMMLLVPPPHLLRPGSGIPSPGPLNCASWTPLH